MTKLGLLDRSKVIVPISHPEKKIDVLQGRRERVSKSNRIIEITIFYLINDLQIIWGY
jgi:hypothetical protein